MTAGASIDSQADGSPVPFVPRQNSVTTNDGNNAIRRAAQVCEQYTDVMGVGNLIKTGTTVAMTQCRTVYGLTLATQSVSSGSTYVQRCTCLFSAGNDLPTSGPCSILARTSFSL